MQKIIFITGVSGSGKTTIGKLLAKDLDISFFDGDDFHSDHNVSKMNSGVPLTDEDRWGWLEAIRNKAFESKPAVFACSALKEKYRDLLIKGQSENDFHFVHLQGDKSLILERMQQRKGHFMPSSLLDSQFEAYENPNKGTILNIAQSPESLVQQIKKILSKKSEIGVVGLGVMGTSIARNIAKNGFALSIYNRHVDNVEVDVAKNKRSKFVELTDSQAFDDVPAFVESLATPRKILLMVNAGKAVDQMIEALTPHLSKDDIIIDGGNSHYRDTQDRYDHLKSQNIHFIGCGISGGEEGALKGPSMMPGAAKDAYSQVKEIFEKIAAHSPLGTSCCNYIGSGGAGHFVKMVHNGIEYGEMQLIAEFYAYLRYACNLSTLTIADLFSGWSKDGMDSYLLEITIDILRKKDENSNLVLDQILDKAGNKGTGAWTTIAAAELGVAIPTITAALFARYQSFFKSEREELSKKFEENQKHNSNTQDDLKQLYQLCRILNHRQGIELIKAASNKHDWNIDLNNLITVWTAGCIIRSSLLIDILKGLDEGDFIQSPHFVNYFKENLVPANKAYKNLSENFLPNPAIAASMEYFKSLVQANGNANLIQAQRDYFGAHTYKLKTDPDGPSQHHFWTKT